MMLVLCNRLINKDFRVLSPVRIPPVIQTDRQPLIVREVFDNGVRLITERMDHLRSVSVGVWLTRGSRDEPLEQSGIAHFIEHMLFKGTGTRSAEDIAQAIDSVGGHLDAFTAKEYASYYIKVLDEHLPFAWDILADIVRHPALRPDDIEREKKVILEEIKMVEDTPDDLVHELFTQALWARPRARAARSSASPRRCPRSTTDAARDFFERTYVAPNLLVVAVGNVEHAARSRSRRRQLRHALAVTAAGGPTSAPRVVPQVQVRTQGARAEPHLHGRRQLPAAPRRPLHELRPEHGARRLDELAAVPERAREARPRLRGVQRPRGLSRHGQPHDLRRLRQRRRWRGHRRRRRRGARHEGRRCPTPSCAARRIT